MMQWKNNVFVRTTILVLAVFCLVTIVSLQIKYNDLQSHRDALLTQIEASKQRIGTLEEELASPFDDEYVIRIAREKLNYRLPEEIVFYNDLNQ